jgi:hypothetical protein
MNRVSGIGLGLVLGLCALVVVQPTRPTLRSIALDTTDDYRRYLTETFAPLSAARLQPGPCGLMFGPKLQRVTVCFVSPVPPDQLKQFVQQRADTIGTAPLGWTRSYGVWGAVYALKADARRTFGIGINPTEDDFRLTAVKAFPSYLVFTVDR